MKASLLCLCALAMLFALCDAALAQAPTIAGNWDLVMVSPVGQHPLKASFSLEGEKLSGVMKGETGDLPFEGTLADKKIRIAFKVPYQGTDLLITLIGDVDGDSMKGAADFGGLAQGDWSGKRSTAGNVPEMAAKSPAEERIDVTGTWAFQVETSMGSGAPTFTFKQDGEKLAGQYKGMLGEAEITGSIKEHAISFTFKINAQGAEMIVSYEGIADKDSMKGKFHLGDAAEGTFTAKRQ
jgi:hypothetical protein